MNSPFKIIFFLLCCQYVLPAQNNFKAFDAIIALSWEEGNAVVEARFINLSKKKEPLTYQLKLQRKSKNGNNISNQQSGSFISEPQSQQILALTKFDVTELDLYRIYLRVYRKGKLIAEDAIVNWPDALVNIQKRDQVGAANPKNPDLNNGNINPKHPKIKLADRAPIDPQTLSKEATQNAKIAEARQRANAAMAKAKEKRNQLQQKETTTPSSSNIPVTKTPKKVTLPPIKKINTPQTPPSSRIPDLEIDGLIIDETRTKIGRDYYEVFYNQWEAPKGAKNFTIKIKELPSRGRGAQIQVFVNDEKLIHRSVQPRQEMIEDLASRSVNALAQWLVKDAQKQKDINNEGFY